MMSSPAAADRTEEIARTFVVPCIPPGKEIIDA